MSIYWPEVETEASKHQMSGACWWGEHILCASGIEGGPPKHMPKSLICQCPCHRKGIIQGIIWRFELWNHGWYRWLFKFWYNRWRKKARNRALEEMKSSRWPLEPYILGKVDVHRITAIGKRKVNLPMIGFYTRPDQRPVVIVVSWKELKSIKDRIEKVLKHEGEK